MSPAPETLADLSLSRAALDRAAHRRKDPDLVPTLLADPGTKVMVLAGGSTPVVGTDGATALHLRGPEAADVGHLALFLGQDAGGAAYLAVVADATDEGDPREWRTLREVGTLLDDRDAGLFTTALALANWHAAHTHCPRCGSATVPEQGGWTRRCRTDGSEHYPRTDPAVIMSVVDPQDRLLLARGPQWQPGRYSVLAGFVEPGESLEAAVRREVHEEVGVVVQDVQFLGNQPWPFPSSLMVGFTARAVDSTLSPDDEEIVEARWVTRAELASGVADGSLGVPPQLSIARRLIERWYGGPLSPAVDWTTSPRRQG